KESLDTVIESCVNFVGVDLNTASVPLLRHVSGLNALTARRLVERRQQQGPFSARSQLLEVDGVGPATFTQAAGFLKIRDEAHPFDRTWIHPESYPIAEKLLETFGLTPEVLLHKDQMPALHAKLNEADLPALARDLGTGEPTLHDIFEALARPERDPREDLPKPIFKKGVLKLEDLSAGMELKGTVLNVVDFGAFVDIGLKDSGLVHISQLANRYIKSPHDVVSVGDVVTIWVMGVDQERKRVSLTMVQPGTERPRSAPGGRRGGPPQQGEGRPQGPPSGERRGGAPSRGPRREGTGAPGGEGGGSGPARGGRPSGRPQQTGPSRVGPRPLGGDRRLERAQAPRPAKPAPPPPPLSKDAITGSVPLRSFGQLKQLFEMRVQGDDDDDNSGEGQEPTSTQTPQNTESSPAPEPQAAPQQDPSSDPQHSTP
ncbi:MAG: helix-hairpin-helix domain-containing protein, partial [Isosphaeraceae bacterium]